MKRIVFLSIILIMATLFTMTQEPVIAERAPGEKFNNNYSWEINADSTADSNWDTTSYMTSGYPPMLFTGLDYLSNLSGYLTVEVTNVDTGTAAAEIVDTTKDSAEFIFYTDWGDSAIQYPIHKLTFTPGVTAVTKKFEIDPDSIVGDRVYLRCIIITGDSDYSVAREACGVTYKVSAAWRATP